MGWDTQIVVLAEGVDQHRELATSLNLADQNNASHISSFIKGDVLFFAFKRRKYAPYWIVENLSKRFQSVHFTLLSDCPDFVGGPGGIVKIRDGRIVDSYGFYGNRQAMIANPHPEQLHQWFKDKGQEESKRNEHLNAYPACWCEENYADRIIPMEVEPDTADLIKQVTETPEHFGWSKLEGIT